MVNHHCSGRVAIFRFDLSRLVTATAVLLLVLALPATHVLAAPVWEGAVAIDQNDYVDPGVIASDKRGNAIALWTQFDASPQEYGIWANRYADKSGWTQPQRLNEYNGQAAQPTVAMNARGRAVAAWIQYSLFDIDNPAPVTSSLWVSTYGVRQGWSAPEQLVNNGTNPLFPQIALDDHGNIIVVWQQTNPTLDITNIYAQRFDVKSGWGDATLIQADAGINSNTPRIAMNDKGNAVVVWGQIHPDNNYMADIGVNYYDAKNGWAQGRSIPGSDGGSVAQAGMDGRGNVIVAFTRMDISTYQFNAFATRYSGSQGWDAEPQLLQAAVDIDASNLQLAVGERGEAVAIWKEAAYSYSGDFSFSIHVNRFEPRSGWQGSQMLGVESTNYFVSQMIPKIGVDNLGNAIAVWEQENPDAATDPYSIPTNVLAFRYTDRKGWDAGQIIQETTANASNVQLSMGENGEAFALWMEQNMNTGASDLWANRFAK